MRMVNCTHCVGAKVIYMECMTCKGEGSIPEKYGDGMEQCFRCKGEGEFTEPCDVCKETGTVTAAFAKLYEADRYVRKQHPEWDGDSTRYDGITVYSMADYFRKRSILQGSINGIRCISDRVNGLFVELWDTDDITLVLRGVAYGYGGEGPTGLIAILSDLWPEVDEVLIQSTVQNMPMSASWQWRPLRPDGHKADNKPYLMDESEIRASRARYRNAYVRHREVDGAVLGQMGLTEPGEIL